MDASTIPPAKETLVVNPYVTVVVCGSDELLVKHGGRSRFSRIIRDEARTGVLGGLLRHFSAPQSVTGMGASGAFPHVAADDLLRIITYLRDAHVLIPAAEHLPHIYLAMQFGGDAVSAIAGKAVGIAGAGSLGGRIGREIARFRPRSLTLLDDRTLQPRDRSYFDMPSDRFQEGTPYAVLAAQGATDAGFEAVATIDGGLSDERAVTALFDASDFVIAALEWYSPSALHALNQAAIAVSKPWMSVFIDGSEAHVGPLYVPGETLCYNEFEIQNESAVGLQDDYLLYQEAQLDATPLCAAHLVLPPFLAVVSGWAATAAIAYLATGRSFLTSRTVRVDFERLSIDYQDVLKLPRCPACSSQRAAYRHTYL